MTPPANAYGVPVTTGIQAEFQNGPTPLKWESIRMLVNRQLVVPQFSRSGSKTIVHYQPTPALIAKTNQIVLTYHDGVRTQTNSWEFVTTTNRPGRAVVGQWNFDQGDLRGSMGEAMRYLDGPAGASRRAVEFNSTTAFGIPDIGGSPAQVLHFAGAADPKIALIMPHRADPNGGESALRVNEWTLIVDLLVPNAQQEPWLALLQTDADNSSDTDVCIRFDAGRGGLGIRGAYEGEGGVMPGRWHRVAVAVDVGAVTMAKYIDGVLFAIQELPATELDGRYSLAPTILLFGDENGESQEAFVNSVQLRNYAMNEDEVHVLGSPTAKGIPTALPR